MKFEEFPKMARLTREAIITEKIDGTNASILITSKLLELGSLDGEIITYDDEKEIIAQNEAFTMRAGSRTKWITPTDDNFGFAKWVKANAEELFKLGEGHHFGEWWGQGIQRGYGLKEKRFSLFNVARWDGELRPACCHVVPTLWKGIFSTGVADEMIKLLSSTGSQAAPGFMSPEGIVVYHVAGNVGFKKTIDKDELPKSLTK
jgi:hypothetical protein